MTLGYSPQLSAHKVFILDWSDSETVKRLVLCDNNMCLASGIAVLFLYLSLVFHIVYILIRDAEVHFDIVYIYTLNRNAEVHHFWLSLFCH